MTVALLRVGRSVVEDDNDGHAVMGTGERLCGSSGFSRYRSGESPLSFGSIGGSKLVGQ